MLQIFRWLSGTMKQVSLQPTLDDHMHVESHQLSQLQFGYFIVPSEASGWGVL